MKYVMVINETLSENTIDLLESNLVYLLMTYLITQ